jgi:hypothetical protein
MAWTEERTRILTRLWADGWTGSEIGDARVTRGAVVSKARLGLAEAAKQPTAAQALSSGIGKPRHPRRRTPSLITRFGRDLT